MKQYGSDGKATLAQTYIDTTNPVPADFDASSLNGGSSLTEAKTELKTLINGGKLPAIVGSTRPSPTADLHFRRRSAGEPASGG